ncbi:MAG: hypothetical protein RIQ56_513 [Candidatus Parcubacteria bacterium]|jgi:hypothetical protein
MCAKDYFEDITPPEGVQPKRPVSTPLTPSPASSDEKSIRNITVVRPKSSAPLAREIPTTRPIAPSPRKSWLLWVVAGIATLFLGALAMLAFQETLVSVTPRTQTVTFDPSSRLEAYPAGGGTERELTYSLETLTFDDSEVVQTGSGKSVDRQSSGSVTVFNEYSNDPVKLIKSTRFETPDGLIFRAPADILVPGKKGNTPGSIQVSIVADKPGSQYNIGPVSKFSLPGLAGNGDMYTKVYARSSLPMSGGSSVNDPAVDASTLASAQAQMRARLESKVRGALADIPKTSIVFPELLQISYRDLPTTPEADGGVRLHLKAQASIPLFSESQLSKAIARIANIETGDVTLTLLPQSDFAAIPVAVSSTTEMSSIEFTLRGAAMLVWRLDTQSLASALGGKDKSAFQTIVKGFSAVETAKARVSPFWSRVFPDANDIRIEVDYPKGDSQS